MKIIDKLLTNINMCECNHWYERLKFLREHVLEVSQGKFAKLLDLDTSRVSRYETGRGAKELTFNLKNRIKQAFGEEVADWIETGKLPEKNETIRYQNTIGSIHAANVANNMQAQQIVGTGSGESLTTYEMALVEAFRERSKKIDQVTLLAKILHCLDRVEKENKETP